MVFLFSSKRNDAFRLSLKQRNHFSVISYGRLFLQPKSFFHFIRDDPLPSLADGLLAVQQDHGIRLLIGSDDTNGSELEHGRNVESGGQ